MFLAGFKLFSLQVNILKSLVSYPFGHRALQVLINMLIYISINKTQACVSNRGLKRFSQMIIDFYGRYFLAFNQEQVKPKPSFPQYLFLTKKFTLKRYHVNRNTHFFMVITVLNNFFTTKNLHLFAPNQSFSILLIRNKPKPSFPQYLFLTIFFS